MKINRLFHWLYAILMLLPFVSVFAVWTIYTWNTNIEIPTITENVSKEVDLYQVVNPNNRLSFVSYNDYTYYYSNTDYVDVSTVQTFILSVHLKQGHTYYFHRTYSGTGYYFAFYDSYNQVYINVNDDYYYSSSDLDIDCNMVISNFTGDIYVKLNIIDLDSTFGNVPSRSDVVSWLGDSYYGYGLNHIVIDNYSTQSVIDMPINHIWFPSFGGVGWTIRNIINFGMTNLFGISTGNGVGYVIVNLMAYWLCISLIWLIYDVIMYVPLMIHRWLDKGIIS